MRSAIFWVCLLFAGCASIAEHPAPVGPAAFVGDAFYLSGRVSVKFGAQAASGKITWQHDVASDDLMFSTPLGQGVARIVWRDGVASLTTSDQKMYQAGDVETLTEQVLGWRLPLAGMPDWVRGRAAAGTPAQGQMDDAHRLSQLQQSGWQVEFLEYGSGNGPPSRLRLSRENVELRLVIDEWRGAP
jgi:outer membrane lipoprotein LolB